MSDARPEISFEELDQMEGIAKQIHSMPSGANKEKAIQAFKNAHSALLEHMDMPTEAIAPDAHMLGILDWGSGALRSAVGETALGGKAIYDKVTKGKTDWNGAEAADRLTDAIVPMGDPARGSGEYLERLGVPEGTALSDTWAGQKMGVERGGRWDVTARGAGGFGLDMGLTPGNVKSLMRAGEARTAAKLAAESAPKTAATLAKELATLRREQMLAPPKTFWPSAKSTTEAGKTSLRFSPGTAIPGAWDTLQRGISDPLEELGKLLYKGRFADADLAAEHAGKKLPSQIMMENGMPGITERGIRDGMRGIINRTEADINRMATPEEGLFVPTRPQEKFVEPIVRENFSRASKLPGSSKAVEAAVDDALDQFDHAARQEPALMRALQEAKDAAGHAAVDPVTGELLYENGARQMVLPGVPKVTNNSGFEGQTVNRSYPRVRKEIDVPGKPGGMKWEELPDGSKVLKPYPATPPTYKDVPIMQDVPMTEQVWVDRPPTVEPGRPITQTEGRVSSNSPAPKSPLSLGRDFSWEDARQIRRNFQKQASDAGLYSRRDALEPGAQAKVDATSRLHNKIADRAGELELEMLDEASPGLGGKVWEQHRDQAGLLTGAPYLDREFTGGGPTRATTGGARAISPMGQLARDLLGGAKGVAQAAGGKMMMSPWTRKALAPAARAYWLNDFWNREYNESEQNPYGLIKKYGVSK